MLAQGTARAEAINPFTWAPSGNGAYFFDGSNQTGDRITDFSNREQQFGRKFDGHLYYLENCDVTPSMLTDPHWSLATDQVPFVVLSWCGGSNPASIIPQIAAGAYDKDINDFAASVKSQLAPYGHVFVRPFWEFNFTGSEWNDTHYGADPATFIAAWQRVVDLFRSDGLSDDQVKFIWSPNRTGSSTSQDPVPYYPGSSYVDWIGIDAYPKNQFLTLQQLVTTGDGFDWYDTFNSYGKPLMVSETGIQPASAYGPGSPTRAQWWSDLVSEIEGPLSSIKAVEYFDSAPGTNWTYNAPSSDPLDSPSEALAAARAAAQSCALDVLSPMCATADGATPSVSVTPVPLRPRTLPVPATAAGPTTWAAYRRHHRRTSRRTHRTHHRRTTPHPHRTHHRRQHGRHARQIARKSSARSRSASRSAKSRAVIDGVKRS